MRPSDPRFPSPEEGLALHVRLGGDDPVASAEVCQTYLAPLLGWLGAKYPRLDPHFRQTAAHEALMAYVQRPAGYDPGRGDLGAYLRMAARGDLLNLLRREGRHHNNRSPWPAVEGGEVAGNLSGEDEEPSGKLIKDEEAEACRAFLSDVEQRCTEEERRVLRLMVAGERRNAVYAEAIGVTGLALAEQNREVKKVKDRIMKRLTRGGPKHE
jgi:RNA polymerase sigma-70 factor (ECF subfamily)